MTRCDRGQSQGCCGRTSPCSRLNELSTKVKETRDVVAVAFAFHDMCACQPFRSAILFCLLPALFFQNQGFARSAHPGAALRCFTQCASFAVRIQTFSPCAPHRIRGAAPLDQIRTFSYGEWPMVTCSMGQVRAIHPRQKLVRECEAGLQYGRLVVLEGHTTRYNLVTD